jgi:GAF domain-containing protein
MPEERDVIASLHRPPEEAGQSDPSHADTVRAMAEDERPIAERSAGEYRAAALKRMILIGAVLAVIFIGSYVVLYMREGAWQILLDIAGLVVGIICLLPAYRLAARKRVDAAGYWILAALAIVYGSGELAWADATWALIASFILLTVLVGTVAQPRRWGIWLVMAVLYLAYTLLVNQFEPLDRYPILEKSPVTQLIIIPLALLVLWQIVRAIAASSIRIRLLAAFVLLVLLPAAAISSVSAVTGLRSGQEQVKDQLELVADFRQAQIDAWREELQTNLAVVLEEGRTLVYAQEVLAASPNEADLLKRPLEQSFHVYNYRTRHFDELFLLNRDGRKLATSGTSEEYYLLPEGAEVIVEEVSHAGRPYFQQGLRGRYEAFYSPEENVWGVLAVRPVVDARGNVIGVLAGYTGLDELSEIMREQTGLGETVKTYLVEPGYTLLTNPEPGEEEGIHARSLGIDAVIASQTDASGLYKDYRGVSVVGAYRWLPELEVALVAEQERAEAFQSIYTTLVGNVGVALISVLLAVGVSLLVARGIANPLSKLTETATRIAAGDLEYAAKVEREDEIGRLAQAFNSMTNRLRELIGSLEQRVADRTREIERRSAYLEASAEVGRVATSILEADRLIHDLVELIRERFALYYVGLFLVDEKGQWAVLRAGTGEAGQAMLARGHRVKVGEGMIGWSVANAQARIASEAEMDAVRLATPELPDTRSEAALPLRSRGQVVGALTVQSDQPGTFDPDTIVTLQTMADQAAVALDNARLFAESQAALETTRRAYSELSREAWGRLLRTRVSLGVRSDESGVTETEDVWRPEMELALQEGKTVQGDGGPEDSRRPLAVPIKVRDNVVGVLDTYKPAEAGEWTEEEVALLEALADQLGQALESARLYQDTQRRAAAEQMTGEVTSRMRETLDMDTVLQSAAREIREALGLHDVMIQLVPPDQ